MTNETNLERSVAVIDPLPIHTRFVPDSITCAGFSEGCSYAPETREVTALGVVAVDATSVIEFDVELEEIPDEDNPTEIVNCAGINIDGVIDDWCATTVILEAKDPQIVELQIEADEFAEIGGFMFYRIVLAATDLLESPAEVQIINPLPRDVQIADEIRCNFGECDFDPTVENGVVIGAAEFALFRNFHRCSIERINWLTLQSLHDFSSGRPPVCRVWN
ncbi:hypothetical protein ACFL2H_10870 [Planctomycetota bacterium]